jgi:anti-sigma factor RsiW
MDSEITDAELLAYLDEGLPVERMAAVENALRASAELRNRTAGLRSQRDEQGHSVGEIWRRGRLSCPTRHQLGSFLLGALPSDLAQYFHFHLETVGCRYCTANLEDLRQSANQATAETAQRRQKFFQSSAGYVRKLDPDRS